MKINAPAPNFTLPDLDGQPQKLIDYAGKIVVINFWSAECPWVARTDPVLKGYLTEWGKKAILLTIAPNANETPEEIARVSNERGFFPVLLDADRSVADLYEAQATPHFFVLDPEGILRYQGAFDDVTWRKREPTQFYLKDAVDALTKGEPPDPAETAAYGCSIVYFGE